MGKTGQKVISWCSFRLQRDDGWNWRYVVLLRISPLFQLSH